MLTIYMDWLGTIFFHFISFGLAVLAIVVAAGAMGTISYYPAKWLSNLKAKPIEGSTVFSIVFGLYCIGFLPLGLFIWQDMHQKQEGSNREKIMEPPKIERYLLKHISAPTHVYATLEHVPSGTRYPDLYVAKNCSNWNAIKANTEFSMPVQEWYYKDKPEEKFVIFPKLQATFCD